MCIMAKNWNFRPNLGQTWIRKILIGSILRAGSNSYELQFEWLLDRWKYNWVYFQDDKKRFARPTQAMHLLKTQEGEWVGTSRARGQVFCNPQLLVAISP